MNKKLGLAVAGALLALSSTANAGITIPAGDWTIDIGGNVNAFANTTRADRVKGDGVDGGLAATPDAEGEKTSRGISTGLLPAFLSVSGKTRQNDLDVAFTMSIQPNVSTNSYTGDGALGTAAGDTNSSVLSRQAFITFGDASWGSIKLGKDLGIFASDAILNDMTLLGVGSGGGLSGTALNSTNGGIGTGYIYAAWKGQIAYTSPNWNGFQFTAGITNPNQGFGAYENASGDLSRLSQDRFGYEGKASYTWAGDYAGKVWASAASYDVTGQLDAGVAGKDSYRANAWDIGANVNVAGFGLTGYYYDGKGVGTTFFGNLGALATANGFKRRDSNGGYVQATYVIPTGTKLGVAYGKSTLDNVAGDAADLLEENKRYTVGAYHPLTKSLNLVAEWSKIKSEAQVSSNKTESDTYSVGAILFF